MICCVDVDYRADGVTAACVGFVDWTAAVATVERVVTTPGAPAEYTPGRFYERELPHLLAVLAQMPAVSCVVVDAYVWLAPGRAGLGAHVHETLRCPVIGVAKTRFEGAAAVEVLRGDSAQPLHITAAGIDPQRAAAHVREMHGPYRIPTLIKRADTLARGRA